MKDQTKDKAISKIVCTITNEPDKAKDAGLWRDLVAFWFLGICNNYGFIVMLAAAHDIIHELSPDQPSDVKFVRNCNSMSTGTVLLADIVPAIIIKIFSSFVVGFVHTKVIMAMILTIISFVTVAFADTEWLALLGVVLTSLSMGLGETALVGYLTRFNRSCISCWSSGTGGAGLIGTISYSAMKQIGISNKTLMLCMISVPIFEAFIFWGLLRHRELPKTEENEETEVKDAEKQEELGAPSILDRIKYIPKLLRYMIPLFIVYFSQYFINQGLLELIYFPNIWLKKADQYRWFQATYQISVFISRSSINLVKFKAVWLLALLQCGNLVYLLFEAIYYFSPNIYVVFLVVFLEGLFGGGAYAKTFYRVSEEIPERQRQFSMSIITVSDTPGIALSGLIAMPVHNAICNLPIPGRLL
ncbi:battenin-like [Culicoides brevitarsis]|uniref:battenin-like n=1 Tax=Culicoides brevitarsis TaxID=469753 RepID=UPI00307BF740